jgi:hypothetical protein
MDELRISDKHTDRTRRFLHITNLPSGSITYKPSVATPMSNRDI